MKIVKQPTLDIKIETDAFSDAIISNCGKYRHWLTRHWDDTKEMCAFIMLNPSTADASEDDPTIRRCISFAKSWGYGGLVVVNLFDYRSTDPKYLTTAKNPCSDLADHFINQALETASLIVCAWGNLGSILNRSKQVRKIIEDHDILEMIHCLGLNKSGEPKHPLYVRADQDLIEFNQTTKGE